MPPATGTLDRLLHAAAPTVAGRVTAVGLSVDVAGLDLGVGEAVQLDGDTGPILAEVVALHDEVATCCPSRTCAAYGGATGWSHRQPPHGADRARPARAGRRRAGAPHGRRPGAARHRTDRHDASQSP